jgi:hypothetical protein
VKLGVQRLHSLLDLQLELLLAARHRVPLLADADVHVELSNLVSVLARSWDLDWTCPVKVEVAESEGQLFDLNASKGGVILRYKEVSR